MQKKKAQVLRVETNLKFQREKKPPKPLKTDDIVEIL